jgi:predicted O-linked N-acetylglucosamine transferase (SPINDLY family)
MVVADAIRMQQTGRLEEAAAICRRILTGAPNDPAALHVLGLVLCQRGDGAEGLQAMARSVELAPRNAEWRCNFGAMLGKAGRHEESLLQLREAVGLVPQVAGAHYNLGITLEQLKRFADAGQAFRQAVKLSPQYAEAHGHLGDMLGRTACFARAAEHCRRAVELRPGVVSGWKHMVLPLMEQGRLGELLECRRKILEMEPGSAVEHSNYLATLFYDGGISAADYFAACRKWDQTHAAKPLGEPVFDNDADPERALRVGYVSAHFTFHVVGRLLLPLFKNHDRQAVEVYCYSTVGNADGFTERLKSRAAEWRDIGKMSGAQAAELIRRDKIDILVDTIGHFGGCVLPLFSLKPAPVLVTHYGHFSTTGVKAIDYRMTDSITDPVGESEAHNVEELVRIDPCAYCYLPEDPVPEATALPALANGFVTFGCLNNLIKMTDPCVDVWCRVLKAVAGSKLMLLAHGDELSKKYTRDRFIQRGIDGGRIELASKCKHEEYIARFGRMDMALDPFPYNGDNTTCDGLWCGVPVLTLAGKWSIARRGMSHLTAIGMEEWIAATPEEYVAKAVGFAGDLGRLAGLRRGLRARMQDSPLCDGTGFARKIEAAYRVMWRRWCEERGS